MMIVVIVVWWFDEECSDNGQISIPRCLEDRRGASDGHDVCHIGPPSDQTLDELDIRTHLGGQHQGRYSALVLGIDGSPAFQQYQSGTRRGFANAMQ
jgi:hypothetical protein